MKTLSVLGRILLGIAYAIFGYLHFAHASADMTIVPKSVGSAQFWVYFVGICWFATALSFFTNILTRMSGVLASIMLLLILFFIQIPGFKGAESYISLASTIALIGGSLIVSGNSIDKCVLKKE